jgi:U3 small nucleolar RNA-associated protein 10
MNGFLQNDSFEVLCDPIGDLFDLCNLEDYNQLVNLNFKPMILEMDERTSDDNMWQKLNLTLLMKTRSENWETRLAVLSVIDHLFEKMRERYLVILNDTIPFVSELLEDENEKVELAAKTIVNRIEQLTGESINEYLK